VKYNSTPPCPPVAKDDWGYECCQGDFGIPQALSSRQGYYGSVSLVDQEIGHILKTIETRGWQNNSVFMFLSDHGDMLNDHFLWRKSYPLQSAAHVPLIISWPGVVKPQIISQVVELRDILPTVLEIGGFPNASEVYSLDGQSLVPLLQTEEKEKAKSSSVQTTDVPWREWIDLEHDIYCTPEFHWSGLTDGVWKYIFWAMDGAESLFHLPADPHELTDLAANATYQPTLQLWRGRLTQFLTPRGPVWVKDGVLQKRPQSILYSPNYPGPTPPPAMI